MSDTTKVITPQLPSVRGEQVIDGTTYSWFVMPWSRDLIDVQIGVNGMACAMIPMAIRRRVVEALLLPGERIVAS